MTTPKSFNTRQDEELSFHKGEEGLDLAKLKAITKKSWFWILLLFLVSNLAAYLFLRYTKPIYESSSVLKLDLQSEATELGFNNPLENTTFNSLSGEMEILKSKLFFSEVVNAIDMKISYHQYGKILTEERYRNNPFEVQWNEEPKILLDRKIDIDILDSERFVIHFAGNDKANLSPKRFGEAFQWEGQELIVNLTDFYLGSESNGQYFFIIHSHQSMINYFDRNLEVEPLNLNAKTIKVSLKDHTRNKARDIMAAIDTLYINFTKEKKNQATRQKIAFLDMQLEQTEKRMEEHESYFEDFTVQNKTTNLQTDIGKTIIVLEKLDSQRVELNQRLSWIQEIHDQLLKEDRKTITLANARRLPESLRKGIEEYNLKTQELANVRASYRDNTLAVQRKQNELNTIQAQLFDGSDKYRNEILKGLSEVNKKISSLERDFQTLPSMGTEYSKARRFYSLYEGFYLSLINKKAEFEIAKAGMVTNFTVLSPASLPSVPIYPNALIVHGIGLMGGVFLCLMFLGVRYVLHNKITGVQDIERLTPAPILGAIPYYGKEKLLQTKLIIHQDTRSLLSEALRSVRTNLEFINSGKERKVLSITSTVSGEGKTFVSVNLAAIIAMSGKKVVLLDSDLRKPKVHLAMGDENSPYGLSTCLIKKHALEECIKTTAVENLYYIPAGPTPPNPSELLLSEALDQLITKLKKDFDIVIFDTPPVGMVTDGILVMKRVDHPIYVFKADYSKKDFAQTLNRLRKLHSFPNISVILNSIKSYSADGYGSYKGYGGNYYENSQEKEKSILNFIKGFFA